MSTNIIKIKCDFSTHSIKKVHGPFERCRVPMLNLGTDEYKILNTKKITPVKYFTDTYEEWLSKPESICTSTKLLNTILDAK